MPLGAELLKKFGWRYVWWKKAEDAIKWPERIVVQVMNLGDYDDVQSLIHQAGVAYLRQVLMHAEAGQFDLRFWTYCYCRLGLSEPGEVPALPQRRLV